MKYGIMNTRTQKIIYVFETKEEAEEWLTKKAELKVWVLDFLKVTELPF